MSALFPRLVVLSGVDPTGGAGLALDLRVAARHPLRIGSVPTCLTDQDRNGFRGAEATAPDWLLTMLRAVEVEGPIAAVKIGLCVDVATVERLASWLAALPDPRPAMVVDPVLSATAGGGLARAVEVAHAIATTLVPLGVIVTPNHDELRALAPRDGVVGLLGQGARGVLLKDGHGAGDRAVDRLTTLCLAGRPVEHRFEHGRLARGPVHGTGCALATGLAARLALGGELASSTGSAIADVTRWIANTPDSRDGRPDAIALD